jgi:succinate-acetate transporter protein
MAAAEKPRGDEGRGEELVAGAARVVLRPLGNPLPLGFLALAAATLLVAALQLGWIASSEGSNVALVLIAFVAPLQLLTSIFGYLSRDVVAGTGMGILAGTWLTVGLVTITNPPGSTSDALGMFLLIAGVAMLVPAAAASAGKLAATAVLATTALRFLTSGIFELSANDTWADISGVIGLLLCALAVYAALAMALEDARGETVLPLGRRGRGRDALEGGFGAQIAGVEHEAGVREQL